MTKSGRNGLIYLNRNASLWIVWLSTFYHSPKMLSDASNDALGVVIFENGRVSVLAREWSTLEKTLSINAKEVIAACQGVIWISPYPGETIFLGVDNTAAFFDIISGQSADPVANWCIGYMRRSTALAIIWIPTQLMPADAPSRNADDPDIHWKVITILEHTTRYAYLPKLI